MNNTSIMMNMYTNELSETETPEPVADVLRTMSEEERNLRNMRKAIRTIERLTENEPSNNIYKIKQELMKIEKILKQTRLTDLIEEDVEQRIRPVKSEMPGWEEQANRSFGTSVKSIFKCRIKPR